MAKKILWVGVGFFFLVSAGLQLLTFTCLYLGQEVRYYETSRTINQVEFGLSLFIFLVALFVFGYFAKKLISRN